MIGKINGIAQLKISWQRDEKQIYIIFRGKIILLEITVKLF